MLPHVSFTVDANFVHFLTSVSVVWVQGQEKRAYCYHIAQTHIQRISEPPTAGKGDLEHSDYDASPCTQYPFQSASIMPAAPAPSYNFWRLDPPVGSL